MKLKKATNIKTNYPSKESIKPLLTGLGLVLSLSACSHTPTGQKPIIADENRNPPIETSENIAGGMPVLVPPPKEQNSSKIDKFKRSR